MSQILDLWESMTGVEVVYEITAAPPAGWLTCDGTALQPGPADRLRAKLIAAGSPFGVDGDDPLLPDRPDHIIRT